MAGGFTTIARDGNLVDGHGAHLRADGRLRARWSCSGVVFAVDVLGTGPAGVGLIDSVLGHRGRRRWVRRDRPLGAQQDRARPRHRHAAVVAAAAPRRRRTPPPRPSSRWSPSWASACRSSTSTTRPSRCGSPPTTGSGASSAPSRAPASASMALGSAVTPFLLDHLGVRGVLGAPRRRRRGSRARVPPPRPPARRLAAAARPAPTCSPASRCSRRSPPPRSSSSRGGSCRGRHRPAPRSCARARPPTASTSSCSGRVEVTQDGRALRVEGPGRVLRRDRPPARRPAHGDRHGRRGHRAGQPDPRGLPRRRAGHRRVDGRGLRHRDEPAGLSPRPR